MDLGLTDRVYIVTGGSRGLGRASVDALVADGARVVVSARGEESLRDTVDALGADRVTSVAADLADPSTPGRLVEAALAAYGRLDGALVSVGGPPGGTVMEVPDEHWSAAFESVFLGAVRLTRTVVGALSDGGSVALVLSSTVKVPIGSLGISNGLRPGLAMVVKALADEVGPQGIRVNALLPGRVDTERVRELDASAGDSAEVRRTNEQTIPLRRYGDPAEFGRVAAFLLAPASSFVTGALVPVDGGMLRAL